MKKGLKDFCNDLLKFVSERRTTFRFVFPEILHFTLIELLVSVTCQIGVLPLYFLKKSITNGVLRIFTDGNGLQCSKKQWQGLQEFCGAKNCNPLQEFLEH